jgi:hypothetical protein
MMMMMMMMTMMMMMMMVSRLANLGCGRPHQQYIFTSIEWDT